MILIERLSIVIRSGTAVSEPAHFAGKTPNVLHMSDGWDAAAISFMTSPNGTSFYYCYDTAGLPVSLPAAALRRICLPTTYLQGSNGFEVVSGVPGMTVNQTVDRTLYLEVWE